MKAVGRQNRTPVALLLSDRSGLTPHLYYILPRRFLLLDITSWYTLSSVLRFLLPPCNPRCRNQLNSRHLGPHWPEHWELALVMRECSIRFVLRSRRGAWKESGRVGSRRRLFGGPALQLEMWSGSKEPHCLCVQFAVLLDFDKLPYLSFGAA